MASDHIIATPNKELLKLTGTLCYTSRSPGGHLWQYALDQDMVMQQHILLPQFNLQPWEQENFSWKFREVACLHLGFSTNFKNVNDLYSSYTVLNIWIEQSSCYWVH